MARDMTHYYVAHQSALLENVALHLNLPRTHPVFIASIVELIHALIEASILLSPFHSDVPQFSNSQRQKLMDSGMGAWVVALRCAGWKAKGCEPLLEIRGYINSHFPTGVSHIWSHELVIEQDIFNPA